MKESSSKLSSTQTTSDSAVALAAFRLQAAFIRQTEQGIFCSVEPLGALAIHARDVRRTAPLAEQRVLAFVLESVLRRLLYDLEDRPAPLSEYQRIFKDPVASAIDYLVGKSGDATAIADALVQAASDALPT